MTRRGPNVTPHQALTIDVASPAVRLPGALALLHRDGYWYGLTRTESGALQIHRLESTTGPAVMRWRTYMSSLPTRRGKP